MSLLGMAEAGALCGMMSPRQPDSQAVAMYQLDAGGQSGAPQQGGWGSRGLLGRRGCKFSKWLPAEFAALLGVGAAAWSLAGQLQALAEAWG